MAPIKKTVAPVTEKKATASAAVEAPKAEVKKAETAATTVKAEPAKEAVVKVETEKKEEPAKKAPAPAKKEPAKKTKTTTVKNAPAKKAEVKSALHIQFSGKSYADEDLMKIAKDVWKYDLKQKAGDLTNVELYVKPEENKVYYVMNNITGSFDI